MSTRQGRTCGWAGAPVAVARSEGPRDHTGQGWGSGISAPHFDRFCVACVTVAVAWNLRTRPDTHPPEAGVPQRSVEGLLADVRRRF